MNSEIDSNLLETPQAEKETNYHEAEDHTVATGIGVAGGGAAGAAFGLTIAGPVGAVIGGIIGAVVGGVGSNAVAEGPEAPGSYEPLMVPPTHEQIAQRAWKYFEEQGKTNGHDLDDWIRAERDLYRDALAARGDIHIPQAGLTSEAA